MREPIHTTGLLSLVGTDDQVDQNDFSNSAQAPLPGSVASGEILAFLLLARETGSGAVQDSDGTLLILSANPNVSAGDTAITAAAWETVIATVDIAASDWLTDVNGGAAYIQPSQPVPFHGLDSLFFLWFHTDATSLNDAPGDDETLQVEAWYRLEP